jgi:hypothetical protein
MSDFITYKHSYNSGDLITVLPGIKHIHETTGQKAIIYQRLNLPADYGHNDFHPIKSDEGTNVCMNQYMFDMMKPLIDYQDYVEEFRVWQGEEVVFDYDKTRMNSMMPLPGGDIYHWPTLIFPQLKADVSEPWIYTGDDDINRDGYYDYILINRTERYRNPYIHYFFLKDYQDKIKFTGTDREHELFNKEFNLNIEKLNVKNFYYLALYISKCKFLIGNQSLAYHISEATFTKRILEVCTQFPNTFPKNIDGNPFINQGSLEYYFHQLLKETE